MHTRERDCTRMHEQAQAYTLGFFILGGILQILGLQAPKVKKKSTWPFKGHVRGTGSIQLLLHTAPAGSKWCSILAFR